MEWIISLCSDVILMLFDLIMYMKLTPFKNPKKSNYIFASIMCILMLVAYLILTYGFDVAYSVASFTSMTIPSLILFFCLSKYKNAKFLITFCFVDTITLTIAAFSKVATILGGLAGSLVSFALLTLLVIVVLNIALPYSDKYKALLDSDSKGFGLMALTSLLIYFLLIFAAAYPSPLITRLNEVPTYLLFCITVISFYLIFIMLIKEKAKLVYANKQLKQQEYWKDLAFIDDLTKIGNKTAYDTLTTELENNHQVDDNYTLVLFDLDNLKHVNDTFGHLAGNNALINTVALVNRILSKDKFTYFRVGGDEFIALGKNVDLERVKEQVEQINTMSPHKKFGYSCSSGLAVVDFNDQMPFKVAADKADKLMYEVKSKKKNHRNK